MPPTVVLTGFMGTGKSAVGRLLAKRLRVEFVDTDALIEAQHGPIDQIFERAGEAQFRRIEREVASDLAGRGDLVISTGGRMMLDDDNVEAFADAEVFCLVASVDTIHARVTTVTAPVRPLLAVEDPRARIDELLAERAEGYARFTQVPTDDRTPSQVADLILDLLADLPDA